LQKFIDAAVRWAYGWSRLVMGHKEAEVAEVKSSQNLQLHSKTALNPHKIRQQSTKTMSNNDNKQAKQHGPSFQLPRHVQEIST